MWVLEPPVYRPVLAQCWWRGHQTGKAGKTLHSLKGTRSPGVSASGQRSELPESQRYALVPVCLCFDHNLKEKLNSSDHSFAEPHGHIHHRQSETALKISWKWPRYNENSSQTLQRNKHSVTRRPNCVVVQSLVVLTLHHQRIMFICKYTVVSAA